jgi:hypothetical protein
VYDGNVRFSWTEPDSNYDQIVSYDLEIFNVAGDQSFKELTHCPGTDPSLLYCLVPIDVLTVAPYNIAFD